MQWLLVQRIYGAERVCTYFYGSPISALSRRSLTPYSNTSQRPPCTILGTATYEWKAFVVHEVQL